ncbi:MAG: pantetheine-phosphate adenylyltransferase [Corynebacterium sp.]|nr:pantetheine-phosphate adenylyltransferase [Corynebacterium sp.]
MRALFPGSFDPLTNGHLDLIERGSKVCEELRVLVTFNPNKSSSLLSPEARIAIIREATSHIPNVTVDGCTTLLATYGKEHGFSTLLKGLRDTKDFNYEEPMAHVNKAIGDLDSLFFITDPQWSYVSSSIVKEIYRYGGDYSGWVPPIAVTYMEALREN